MAMMATGWRMGGLRMRASSGGRAVTGHGRLATPRRARASLLTARANFRPRGLSSLRQTSPGPNRPLPERKPLGSRRGPRPSVAAMASKPDVGDRIIACVPYLLPLLDGLRYGKFFFREFPQAYVLLAPLQPLIKVYYTLPFASLIVFFGLYYGVVQNYNFSRFVRFQAMQTILLDILLIVPSLIENFLLRDVPKSGLYLQFLISSYNFVFLYLLICFLYGCAANLAGEQARLPGVADAADRQVM
mmetsp:Transcript_6263/g.22402  ORF Transcript_6263/g.22402 Transcript_6263/m.22402 type:complete len:245 (-) Transcript_6263:88-822(-)